MRIVENHMDGNSVFCSLGESLDGITQPHSALLSDDMRQAFASPKKFIDHAIASCGLVSVKEFLESLSGFEKCELEIHIDKDGEDSLVGLRFWMSDDFSVLLGPPTKSDGQLPDSLRQIYEVLGFVHWHEYGEAGGIFGSNHPSINDIFHDVDPEDEGYDDLFGWGTSTSGHTLVWSSSNIAGWFLIHRLEVIEVGTIKETVNSIFKNLTERKIPEPSYF